MQHRWTKFGIKIGDVDEKLPDIGRSVITNVLNTKIIEVKNTIPDQVV